VFGGRSKLVASFFLGYGLMPQSFYGALTLSTDPYNFAMNLRNRNALFEPRFNQFEKDCNL
jgi:hypothetical protein